MLILEVLHLDQSQLLLSSQSLLVQLALRIGIKHSFSVTFILRVVDCKCKKFKSCILTRKKKKTEKNLDQDQDLQSL